MNGSQEALSVCMFSGTYQIGRDEGSKGFLKEGLRASERALWMTLESWYLSS